MNAHISRSLNQISGAPPRMEGIKVTENIVIHEKIKQYRKEHGLTQGEFAALLCVSPQTISKWERKDCFPDISVLPALAKVLGCTVDEFFVDL